MPASSVEEARCACSTAILAVGQAGILPVYPEARRSEFVWPRARSLCYGYFCAQEVLNRPIFSLITKRRNAHPSPWVPVETSALEQRIKLALAPELTLDSLGKRLNSSLTKTV